MNADLEHEWRMILWEQDKSNNKKRKHKHGAPRDRYQQKLDNGVDPSHKPTIYTDERMQIW